jgi:hypothetical protein
MFAAAWPRFEAEFRDVLARGRERGEINGDPQALARFLVCAMQGLCLVGKAIQDRATLEEVKTVALRCLDD